MILLLCYHAPNNGLTGCLKEDNFKQFLNFVKDIKEKLKCDYLICGVDSNLVRPLKTCTPTPTHTRGPVARFNFNFNCVVFFFLL